MRSSTKRLLLKGAIAYALLIVAGWAGGHRWFLGRPKSAAALACLAVGSIPMARTVWDPLGFTMFCAALLWLVIDFCRLPSMVVAAGPRFFGKELDYATSDRAGPAPTPPPPPERVIGAAPSLDERIDRAAALAGDEATALALRRFGEVRHRLSGQGFDADLAAEVEVIERRHFAALVDEYAQSRPYCGVAAGASADRTLKEGVGRLTARLLELSQMQAGRDIGELETMEHYLRERHPIAEDDPLGNASDRPAGGL